MPSQKLGWPGADLDTMGSFGGKTEPTEQVQKDPVVFVHGVSDRAWDKPKYTGDFFKQVFPDISHCVVEPKNIDLRINGMIKAKFGATLNDCTSLRNPPLHSY
uniref:Uncharacterized protein n=1 Tax=Parascaris equorum TaxID=6256 RepID=A0A914RM58_PAREQ